jgi:hypothetical protein
MSPIYETEWIRLMFLMGHDPLDAVEDREDSVLATRAEEA